MSAPDNQELRDTITDLLVRTRDGGIDWSRSNPTTFVWIKNLSASSAVIVTIQKIEKKERVMSTSGLRSIRSVEHYVFQVSQSDSKAMLISLNTEDELEFKSQLAELYEIASSSISRKGVLALRRALGG